MSNLCRQYLLLSVHLVIVSIKLSCRGSILGRTSGSLIFQSACYTRRIGYGLVEPCYTGTANAVRHERGTVEKRKQLSPEPVARRALADAVLPNRTGEMFGHVSQSRSNLRERHRTRTGVHARDISRLLFLTGTTFLSPHRGYRR